MEENLKYLSSYINDIDTYNGGSIWHVVAIEMAVCTEVHAAGDTREWPLLTQTQSTMVAIFPVVDLHTIHYNATPQPLCMHIPDCQRLQGPRICTMVPNLSPGFVNALSDSPPKFNKVNQLSVKYFKT